MRAWAAARYAEYVDESSAFYLRQHEPATWAAFAIHRPRIFGRIVRRAWQLATILPGETWEDLQRDETYVVRAVKRDHVIAEVHPGDPCQPVSLVKAWRPRRRVVFRWPAERTLDSWVRV